MHLIEIFLPLSDNAGQRFGSDTFAAVRRELTATFGGLTAFSRAPPRVPIPSAADSGTTTSSCSR